MNEETWEDTTVRIGLKVLCLGVAIGLVGLVFEAETPKYIGLGLTVVSIGAMAGLGAE